MVPSFTSINSPLNFLQNQIFDLLLSFTNTGNTQKNGAFSEVTKKIIYYPTWAQHTLSPAGTVRVSHVLPAVRFSCLLRGRGIRFQDGVAAVETLCSDLRCADL
jgi:hypothetical protein